MNPFALPLLFTLVPVALLTTPAQAGWTIIPTKQMEYQVWDGQDQLFSIEPMLIGPGWSRAEWSTQPTTEDSQRLFSGETTFGGRKGEKIPEAPSAKVEHRGWASGPSELNLETTTRFNRDAKAIGTGIIVSTTDHFSGGKIVATGADGTTLERTTPLGQGNLGKAVKSLTLTSLDGSELRIRLSKPLSVTSDRGELRIWTWAETIQSDTPESATVTFQFPVPISFTPANRLVDTSKWIEFKTRQDFAPGSMIGTEKWLDAPAGKHGWVQMEGQHFVFEKKRDPFKFWGTNIAFSWMAVPPEQAKQWAEKFAKYGVNIVRYHKWTGNKGWDGLMSRSDVLEFDEERCRLFDNIHSEMKNRGIYAGWSPIFAPTLDDSMAKYISNYPEIQAAVEKRPQGLFTKSLYPLSTFAPDVQDFFIALTVKWLERKNSVTGMRYAEDPAVAYVELHNEADIFFPGTGQLVKLYPTYTKQINERFAGWLAKKYPSEEALAQAWGRELKAGESIAAKNIFPFPNYNGSLPAPRRVADSYHFLYDYQNEFYDRYIAAIRKTGYKGAIVGGCWQAADMLGHLLNIASDRRAGFIDRHNYFRGDRPMLTDPGSALLSAGMQQVGDRPFGLTEWACGHLWASEAQPLLGLIGLGLNGWDYSAQFASGHPALLPDNAAGINANFDELIATGQHAFIARFLYSGALKEGKIVGSRRISLQELESGNIGFEERFSLLSGANLKNFTGAVPNEALGAGRVTLDFVPEPVEPKVLTSDLDKYWDRERRILHASNDQIVWNYNGRGFFTVDTPVAQAVIGFGGDREHRLRNITLRYENSYANIYIAAQNPGETLATAKRLIIMTLGRTANRGDLLEETSMTPLVRSEASQQGSPEQKLAAMLNNPRLLVEPVTATIGLQRTDPCRVFALDHDGCKPSEAKEIQVTVTKRGQEFTLKGADSAALYYVVEYE